MHNLHKIGANVYALPTAKVPSLSDIEREEPWMPQILRWRNQAMLMQLTKVAKTMGYVRTSAQLRNMLIQAIERCWPFTSHHEYSLEKAIFDNCESMLEDRYLFNMFLNNRVEAK